MAVEATGAGQGVERRRRELPADHLGALSEPVPFAALTVELIDVVLAARQPTPTAGASPSSDAAWVASSSSS